MMEEGILSLRWNNHASTFVSCLSSLHEKGIYSDITVVCDGKYFAVHKLVLSVCSEYFEEILTKIPCDKPIIVLKDITHTDFHTLLCYMYVGEANVAQSDLARLIKAAECLKVKGLALPDGNPSPETRKRSLNNAYNESDRIKRRREYGLNMHGTLNLLTSDDHVPNKEHNVLSSNMNLKYTGNNQLVHIVEDSAPPSPLHTIEIQRHNTIKHQVEPQTVTNDGQTVFFRTSQLQQMSSNEESSLIHRDIIESHQINEDVLLKQIQYCANVKKEEKESSADCIKRIKRNDRLHLVSVNENPAIVCGGRLHSNEATSLVDGNRSLSNEAPTLPVGRTEDEEPHEHGGAKLMRDLLSIPNSHQETMVPWDGSSASITGISVDNFSSHVKNTMVADVIEEEEEEGTDDCVPITSHNCKSEDKNKANVTVMGCPFCHRAFMYRSDLSRHVRTHTGERPFQCPHCDYKASQKSHLIEHTKRRHPQSANFITSDPVSFISSSTGNIPSSAGFISSSVNVPHSASFISSTASLSHPNSFLTSSAGTTQSLVSSSSSVVSSAGVESIASTAPSIVIIGGSPLVSSSNVCTSTSSSLPHSIVVAPGNILHPSIMPSISIYNTTSGSNSFATTTSSSATGHGNHSSSNNLQILQATLHNNKSTPVTSIPSSNPAHFLQIHNYQPSGGNILFASSASGSTNDPHKGSTHVLHQLNSSTCGAVLGVSSVHNTNYQPSNLSNN